MILFMKYSFTVCNAVCTRKHPHYVILHYVSYPILHNGLLRSFLFVLEPFRYFFDGRECVGHSFANVTHFVFWRDVWNRSQRAAVASKRATNWATNLANLATHLPFGCIILATILHGTDGFSLFKTLSSVNKACFSPCVLSLEKKQKIYNFLWTRTYNWSSEVPKK